MTVPWNNPGTGPDNVDTVPTVMVDAVTPVVGDTAGAPPSVAVAVVVGEEAAVVELPELLEPAVVVEPAVVELADLELLPHAATPKPRATTHAKVRADHDRCCMNFSSPTRPTYVNIVRFS